MLLAQGIEPAALENRPEIPDYLELFFNAFIVLSSRRSYAFAGPNPISFADIHAYLERFPAYDDQLFIHLIDAMDTAYLSKVHGDKSTDERRGEQRG